MLDRSGRMRCAEVVSKWKVSRSVEPVERKGPWRHGWQSASHGGRRHHGIAVGCRRFEDRFFVLFQGALLGAAFFAFFTFGFRREARNHSQDKLGEEDETGTELGDGSSLSGVLGEHTL